MQNNANNDNFITLNWTNGDKTENKNKKPNDEEYYF